MGSQGNMTHRSGFTLVEVSLAVLAVGLGLLSVFSLFPSGLRSGEAEAADTRAGLLAETVFNGMRGNVDAITNWNEWSSVTSFKTAALRTIQGVDNLAEGTVTTPFPQGVGRQLRYNLTIIDNNAPDTYKVVLKVCDDQYGPFDAQSVFYTEFFYKGL